VWLLYSPQALGNLTGTLSYGDMANEESSKITIFIRIKKNYVRSILMA